MSMISELIKNLRWYGSYADSAEKDLMYEAADTIEALSAKLAAANMERSERYYGGGWIACEDKLPDEKGWYLVYAKDQRPFVAYFKGKTFPLNNHYHEIVAWMPLPEPYRP